ncbi:hypothetical protein [Alicyclobacillus acidocaldarius]|uniref:DoxX family protein n=1 Tax=Alicyclobacillus acidocaldarius subsp. acidocaldarius (strain ATCC 27009 / DSM 446 / BCRC 14685 / JCM 5260 / KCTC 1825 / NBRC 15652 / NCIMB 11725 / NRRL B-14509 / 104-IA) TaxID=521098 RepID=C8WQW4_ALIAD|nr:hypothetical protein [Alicyclobacillus acidocaldarius]ACV57292.1 hypothetical protein Aaci_0229 [Alicyclobacillus acidocaldarius subsp. acidocaldarius DSM 446]
MRPHRFQAFVLLIVGYEWLISGLNKVLAHHFVQGLGDELAAAEHGLPYGFYAVLLSHVFVPHAHFFAWLVIVGEWTSGVLLLAMGAIAWFRPLFPVEKAITAATLAIASFMVLNFFFFQGGSYFINPSDPYDEGIPVDFVLFWIQIGLMIALLRKKSSDEVIQPSLSSVDTSERFHRTHGGMSK